MPERQGRGTNIGCHPGQFRDAVARVRAATTLPMFVKLSPNVADVVPFARAAVDEGAQGVSLINTLYGMQIDTDRRRPVLGTGSGGLSGPAILPVGVHWVYKVRAALPDLPIFGIGGISTWQGALQYLMAGADAVQVGPGAERHAEGQPRPRHRIERSRLRGQHRRRTDGPMATIVTSRSWLVTAAAAVRATKGSVQS